MGRVWGNSGHVASGAEVDIQYPPLPDSLLRIIFTGDTVQVVKRTSGYIISLGNGYFPATDLEVRKWVLQNYGEQLNSEHFEMACDLLCERVKQQILHSKREARRKEKAERANLGLGAELMAFYGR
ncbi:hypothetical protein FSC12_01845 [Acinetobacter schindleri]|uniref:hypothetical protein n=1 Tax=Acinetobacter schindleri TaxID=108981 RepID=UPI0013B08EB0|nr:hypothetical protein [Acinetobacter schindleri]QIC60179.1 hypothetical protein FSC12_01845 [Acinetobacter schindleri]